MIATETYRSFEIGSAGGLSDAGKQALAEAFEKPPEASQSLLAGRIRPRSVDIDGIGRVLVKYYYRGGLLRHINRRTYLRIGKIRSAAEFEILTLVRTIGVNAPEPVAFAYRTKFAAFYLAWLAVMEIPGAISLAGCARSDPERARAVMPAVEKQVGILWDFGVLHVDLHPGNVLVDDEDKVYIIDFDKAKTGVADRAGLGEYYVNRWQRAVAKHGLPDFLNELKVDALKGP